MDERLERLERMVAALEQVIARQESRIAALEDGHVRAGEATPELGETSKAVESTPEPIADQWSLSAFKGTPALVGRSLLILAGAFLLRAFTEAGSLATGTGVGLGLAYGASWIFAAAMAARKGARASAGFFGVCAAVIAGPLIFEASTEFGVLSPAGSAAMLAVMTAAGLIVASRWRLPESAWVFVIGALVTAAALAVVRPPGEAATAVLVAIGLAAAWSEGLYRWESLRWLTAVGADIGVLRLTAMATVPGGPHGIDPPNVILVAVLQGVLLLGYVGSSIGRAVRGRHRIRASDEGMRPPCVGMLSLAKALGTRGGLVGESRGAASALEAGLDLLERIRERFDGLLVPGATMGDEPSSQASQRRRGAQARRRCR